MKKENGTMLLFLFCAGMIGGLLLPRWVFANVRLDLQLLEPQLLQQYTKLQVDENVVLEKLLISRLTVLLVLYFSCYSAAGLWMVGGTSLVIGVSMGFFCAMSVLQLKYWGIVFWCSALLPQWLLYGWAGKQIAAFMEKRKRRTEFCKGNAVPVFAWKTVVEFLKILLITVFGILLEVYVNPGILGFFIRFYMKRQ